MALRSSAFHFDRYITSATYVLHPAKRFCMIRCNLLSYKKGHRPVQISLYQTVPFSKKQLNQIISLCKHRQRSAL